MYKNEEPSISNTFGEVSTGLNHETSIVENDEGRNVSADCRENEDWSRRSINHGRYTNCAWVNCVFRHATLRHTTLDSCKLINTSTDFINAQKARFMDVRILRVRSAAEMLLADAYLQDVTISGAIADDGELCNARGMDLSGAVLHSVALENLDLRGIKLAGTEVRGEFRIENCILPPDLLSALDCKGTLKLAHYRIGAPYGKRHPAEVRPPLAMEPSSETEDDEAEEVPQAQVVKPHKFSSVDQAVASWEHDDYTLQEISE